MARSNECGSAWRGSGSIMYEKHNYTGGEVILLEGKRDECNGDNKSIQHVERTTAERVFV